MFFRKIGDQRVKDVEEKCLENPIEEVDIGLVESMSNLFHLFKLRIYQDAGVGL